MEHHARALHEHADRAFGGLLGAATGIQVYGKPNDAVLQRASQHAGLGSV
jgi:hypothetical protein